MPWCVGRHLSAYLRQNQGRHITNISMNTNSNTTARLAPRGVLWASINLGNPVLAHQDAAGQPAGLTVDLARTLAQRLGVPLELLAFHNAADSVKAVEAEEADIGFFAIDPLRGAQIAFTAPYVLIEGCYVVPASSPLRKTGEVDQPGIRVAAGAGSAYDLYLSRELKHAQIIRSDKPNAVVGNFIAQKLDVAAGVRQVLETEARRNGGLRFLPEPFMVIRQAVGLPKSRGEAAATVLVEFVEDMKASGFVAERLAAHKVKGAKVAPAA